mgnify:CR=1 FL=1
MGCWNGTCMISNLTILDGDKLKVVFLDGKSYETQSLAQIRDVLHPSNV